VEGDASGDAEFGAASGVNVVVGAVSAEGVTVVELSVVVADDSW
jgi:hypothetical protein